MDVIAEIKRLRAHVRGNPTMFKDAHTVLTALQVAERVIAEADHIASERDQALARHGAAVLAADEAVKALKALQDKIEPTRAELQRKLIAIESEFDARYDERVGELSALDFEAAAKHVELEEVEGKLQAIATHLGGVNEAL